MRDFLDYLHEAFINEEGGNTYDNSYSNLDLTARSLLGFQTPSGSRITLSSFVRPRFGTSYSIGIKDGWVSYLYSTRPLRPDAASSSDRIPLPDLLRCYRTLSTRATRHAVGHSLVYGRLYLPQSRLEALLASRVTPEVNLTLRAVSQESLRHGGTLLGLASWDDRAGRFGVETLASTDGGVLGLRGLWNATNPASPASPANTTTTTTTGEPPPLSEPQLSPPPSAAADPSGDRERINGRFSAGGEIYYGLLNKSGGMSLGGRFQTLPTHHGTPLTAALTFNLLGHMSVTYAVMAGDCTLASQFGFNFYSYESEWAVGMELWDKRRPAAVPPGGTVPTTEMDGDDEPADAQTSADGHGGSTPGTSTEVATNDSMPSMVEQAAPVRKRIGERSFQAKLEWRLDEDDPGEAADHAAADTVAGVDKSEDESPAGVLRCRCDQNMRIGLMYEGRYKSLLFSLGTDVDLKKLDAPFRSVGLAVQFSS